MLNTAYAQSKADVDFYKQIKNYNISTVLMADTILAEDRENSKEKIKRAEPIGFIGNDYQRFFIHLISVKKSTTNPYEYIVSGKTKVRETIRPFDGKIIIKKAILYTDGDLPNYQQGLATCEVNFTEDKLQTSTGVIKGSLQIGFALEKLNKIKYNALMFYADGFSNNTFRGTWTSYRTKVIKKCNWGDYRIPDSGDLDIGAGEFSANPKYFNKGWKNYILTQFGETEIDVDKAKKNERKKWWN